MTSAYQAGSFWDWAVRAYAAPGVAERCLELQDDQAQCVPLLLWGLWLAQASVSVTPDQAEEAAAVARGYLEHVITPLRTLRHRLKNPVSDVEDDHRLSLREDIKASELKAEAALMQALTGLEGGKTAGVVDGLANLVTLSRAWGPSVPRAHLSALAQAIAAISPIR